MANLVVKPMEPADEPAFRDLATQTFAFPEEQWEPFVDLVGRENCRVAMDDGSVAGGLVYYPNGQWFGGQSIPMAALALVLVAPEFRSRRIGFEMLKRVMLELRDSGFILSSLYPSTQRLYRKLGYEQAGNSHRHACDIRDISGVRSKYPIRRIDPSAESELLMRLDRQRGLVNNGCLDRSPKMLARMYREMGNTVFAYAIGPQGDERGYLVYEQFKDRSGSGRTSVLKIRDMVAIDADAIETIWSYIAGHRTVMKSVEWIGPASDLRFLTPDENKQEIASTHHWMLRLLDVREALLRRGYPKINDSLAFDVSDDLIEANQGPFTLTITDGTPAITEGSTSPTLKVSAQKLAPLYSGLWTASQLHASGQIDCDDVAAIHTTDRIFAGGEPWMTDGF